LAAAITAGAFRADLFYRLNVSRSTCRLFGTERKTFSDAGGVLVKRYAGEGAKQIGKIDKIRSSSASPILGRETFVSWQNIVERSVILCSGDTFWIDEAWLSSQDAPRLESSGPLIQTVQNYEKQLIEAALAGSNGKLRGQMGRLPNWECRDRR